MQTFNSIIYNPLLYKYIPRNPTKHAQNVPLAHVWLCTYTG